MDGDDERRGNAAVWLLVFVLTISALAIRAWDLELHSITQPEAYAPGIEYPAFSTEPIERHSMSTIVRSSLLNDDHPPGYYFLMLPWSKVFGASLQSLRFPSAFLGAIAVPLLFVLARRLEGTIIAMFAATWLTFHGTHVLLSRHARMWTLCTAMALVSVWALTKLQERHRTSWAVTYVGSVAVGLWSDYTFWPFLVAQSVYELASRSRSRTLPYTITLQALAIVLASPIFIFLISRLGSSAYLEAPVTSHLQYFLSLDAWFDGRSIAALGTWTAFLSNAVFVFGALLIGIGLWVGQRQRLVSADEAAEPLFPEWLLWVSLVWPLLFIWLWREQPFDRSYPVRTVTLAVPLIAVVSISLGRRFWPVWQRALSALLDIRVVRRTLADASVMHSLVPFAILLAASTVLPALAPRTTLFLAPFVLILAARALAWVASTPATRIAAISVVVFAGGLSTFLVLDDTPFRDYKGLAAAIDAARRPGDILVIENQWFAQPLHYYLGSDKLSSVEFKALEQPGSLDGVSRAWLVGFGDNPRRELMAASRRLNGYRATLFLRSNGAGALLVVNDR
jgi:uncharacterized membrane protein